MTSADDYLPPPGHFKVRTFGEVPADSAADAVGVFIEHVDRLGLASFYFFVTDETGQIWIVNPSDNEPLCMKLEEWHAAQVQMGLGAPIDLDSAVNDEADEAPAPPKPPARKAAAPTPQPRQRPPRTQAAATPTTPAESRAIPTDPREAIRVRRAQRGQS